MKINVSNVLTIEDITSDLVRWINDNLIIDNPDYIKKERMGFWTGNTPKKLYMYEINGDKVILPYGTLTLIPYNLISDAEITNSFRPKNQVEYKAIIPLYDYQETAVNQMMIACTGILQSAAGSGKTQMGIALATRLKSKTLWLCHTIDLLNQSYDRAKQYIDESLLGKITDGKVHLGKGITFATIQTMSKLNLALYKNEFDVIITDEVHRVAGTPTNVSQYQKVLSSLSAKHKYGLSATVHRADGMIYATYSLVGKVAYIVPDEAIADKIMKVNIKPYNTNTPIQDDALNSDGTINHTKLISYLAENTDRNQLILDLVESNMNRSILILSDRLAQFEWLIKNTKYKDSFAFINGKMTTKKGKVEREQAIEDMRQGNKKVLLATYSLAKEGLDIPRLDMLVMATPVKDYAVVTQAIGRIARTYQNKPEPICYDLVDNIGYCQRMFKKRCTTYNKNKCNYL